MGQGGGGGHLFPAGLWQVGWKPGRGNDWRQSLHPSLILQMTSLRFRKKKELGRQQPARLLAYLQEHRPSQSCHPGCSPASLSLSAAGSPEAVQHILILCTLRHLSSTQILFHGFQAPGYSCLGPASRKTPSKDVFPPRPHPPCSCPSLSTSHQQSASLGVISHPPLSTPDPHHQIHNPSITFILSSKQHPPLMVGSFSPSIPVLRTVASHIPYTLLWGCRSSKCGDLHSHLAGDEPVAPSASCSVHTLTAFWSGHPAEFQPSNRTS